MQTKIGKIKLTIEIDGLELDESSEATKAINRATADLAEERSTFQMAVQECIDKFEVLFKKQ